ncbi:MAG: hypothetical protein A2W91_04525 [Bacteroidetes bacterium GWF2_38_335]|nr:MAG: hypothetical protein A2W91_04525 [Bacteroidetes bacterium GWF2_38_335]HBS88227.1 hypothetical protein [Bacteroidales bacterium]
MKKFILLTLAAFFGLIANAQVNETEITPRIKEVTVYTSSAEIAYEQEVNLKAGKNMVVFTGLSTFIEYNTINVSVDKQDINIITVTDRINFLKENSIDSKNITNLEDSIERLKKEKLLIGCRTDALASEKNVLSKNEFIGGKDNEVNTTEIEKASQFFGRRYYEINKELFVLNEKENDIAYRIKKFESQISQLSVRKTSNVSEIIIVLNSKTAQKAKFNFKYLTSKGGWAPVYDLKYYGPDRPLEFVFRANVFNACGIPWDEVSIKLSTADPISGFNAPTLNGNNEQTKIPENVTYEGKQVTFRQIEVPDVIAEYKIEHQYSVPSDAKPYLVDVSSFEVQSSFKYLLIPKVDPFGFLMADIPDWNRHNLIPGTTNVYNMGTYMGKTFLNTYAPNDTLSVYLGKDSKVQAMRKETIDNKNRNIIGNFEIEESAINIVVKNAYSGALQVELLDQVPYVDEEDKIKLQLFNIEGAEYVKADGELRWNFKLESKETKEISFKYTLKTPKDLWESNRYAKKRFRTISCPAF